MRLSRASRASMALDGSDTTNQTRICDWDAESVEDDNWRAGR